MFFSKDFTEFHQIMFEEAVNPMWLYDPTNLCFVEVNQAVTRFYGYSRTELMRMSIIDIGPTEEIEQLFANINTTNFNDFETIAKERWHHKTRANEILEVEIEAQSVLYDGKIRRLIRIQTITNLSTGQQILPLEIHQDSLPLKSSTNITQHNSGILPETLLHSLLHSVSEPLFALKDITYSMKYFLQQNNSPKAIEYIPLLFRKQHQLSSLFQTISSTSHLEIGVKPQENIICNARALVAEVLEQYAGYAEEQSCIFDYTLPSRALIISTHVSSVQHLLRLVLNNAFAKADSSKPIHVHAIGIQEPSHSLEQTSDIHQQCLRIIIQESQASLPIQTALHIIRSAATAELPKIESPTLIEEDSLQMVLCINIYAASIIAQNLGGTIRLQNDNDQHDDNSPLVYVIDIPLNHEQTPIFASQTLLA